MYAYIRLLSSRVSPDYKLTWFFIQFQTLPTQKDQREVNEQILLFTALLSKHRGIYRLGFPTNKCKFQMLIFVALSPKDKGVKTAGRQMGRTIRVETEDTTCLYKNRQTYQPRIQMRGFFPSHSPL